MNRMNRTSLPFRFIRSGMAVRSGISVRPFAMIEIETTEKLKSVLEEKNKLNVLWFTASWCGPCKQIAPLCAKLGEREGVNMIKIDVDAASDVAADHGISSVPSFHFMIDNASAAKAISGANGPALEKTIDELTKK